MKGETKARAGGAWRFVKDFDTDEEARTFLRESGYSSHSTTGKTPATRSHIFKCVQHEVCRGQDALGARMKLSKRWDQVRSTA